MTSKSCTDRAPVKVDWLDFTLPQELGLLPSFRRLLERTGMTGQQSGDQWLYAAPDRSGVCKLGPTRGVDRVSLSGGVLTHLRDDLHGWSDLLDWLSESPHRITRLDAALDVYADAVPVLRKLRQRTGKLGGYLALGQRAAPVTWVLGRNTEGQETGTMYVGVRGKSQFLARVYDKKHERISKGHECPYPVVRYEIEARGTTGKRSPCLNDLHDPSSLFWHFAAPSLLKRPPDVPEWQPEQFQTFTVPRPAPDPLQRVWRFVEASGFFAGLVAVARDLDGKDVQLERIVRYELQRALRHDTEGASELRSTGATVPGEVAPSAARWTQ